jgi:hypothetical protein
MDGERRAARAPSVTGAERCKSWRVTTLALAAGLGLAASACAATSPEEAACTQVAAIQPCSVDGEDIDACMAYLAGLRTDFGGDGDCRPEYDALVACYRALTACPPPGASSLCPDEITALAVCGRP